MADIEVTVSPSTVTTVEVPSPIAAPSVLYTGVQGPPGADGSSGNSFDQSLNTTDSPTFNALTVDNSESVIALDNGGIAMTANDAGAGFSSGGVSGYIDSDHGNSFSLNGTGVLFKIGDNNDAEVPTSHYGHGLIEYTTTSAGTKTFTLPSVSGTIALTSDLPTGTAAALDVAETGDASNSQVVTGNDSRLSDARAPLSHTQNIETITVPYQYIDHGIDLYVPAYVRTSLTTNAGYWQMTAKSNFATLVNGLVPASQLPSYVDDVLEYQATTNFPATGEAGKIYVATGTGLIYRWSGSVYVEISPSTAQVQSDWNASSGLGVILNKPTLFSGSYTDLTSKPTLGTVSSLDVAASGDASSTQVVKGNDTRLTNARTPSSTLAHASSHASGGSDALTLAASQITGLATVATSGAYSALSGTPSLASVATSGSASDLSTGTLPDARLSSNIATLQAKVSTAQADSTTSASFTDVTGLSGFTLAANTTYVFEFTGRMTIPGSSSFQVLLNSSAALANTSMSGWSIATGTRSDNVFGVSTGTTYYFLQKAGSATNNPSSAFYYIVTGSTAPTIKVQFSQQNTTVGTANLLVGAVASFRKLA